MGKDSGNNAPPDSDMTRMAGPWLPLQAPARGAITDLQNWYRQHGPQQYGPNVTQPFNTTQRNAMQATLNLAGGGKAAGGQYLRDYMGTLGGYVNQDAADMPGHDFYSGLATGSSPYGKAYQDIYNTASGGGMSNTAFDTLEKTAGGGFVGKNPFLDAMYGQGAKALTQNFQESVNPSIEGLLTRTGGGGGSVESLLKGQAQRELGGSLGDLGTKIYGGAYDQDMSRMLGAAQSLPGLEGTRINTMLGAAGGNLNSALTGVQGLQQGQGNAFTQAMQAGGALGGAYQNQYLPYNIMMGVGGQQQQQATAQAQEAQNRFRFNQDAPLNEIQQYLQGLGGVNSMAPNAGAVGAQYAQGVMNGGQPSAFQQAIGNVTGLAGAAAPIVGSIYGPGGYMAGQMMQQMMQQQQQPQNSYGGNWY